MLAIEGRVAAIEKEDEDEGSMATAANIGDEAPCWEGRGSGRILKDPSLGLLNIRGGDTLSASNCSPATPDIPPRAREDAARLCRCSRSDAACAHCGAVAVEAKRSFNRQSAAIAC